MPSAAPDMTVAKAMETCAGELAWLARRCERLQDHLSPLLQRADDIVEAQALDLITQTLAALSDYLAALSNDVPVEAKVDPRAAAAGVTLAGLADRLLGAGETEAEDAGDLDMFGAVS